MFPNYPNYNYVNPETRVMVVDTLDQGRLHEIQSTEDLPPTFRQRLRRTRLIQSIMAFLGVLLLVAIVYIVIR
jgi:hypothetical protein